MILAVRNLSVLLISALITLAISTADAAHSLCQTSLQVADYREQLDGEIFRELTLDASINMIAKGPSYIKKMLGATMRVSYRDRVIFERTLDSDIELTKGIQVPVSAGPQQQIHFSYFEPKFRFAIEVLDGRGRVQCRNQLSGSVLTERANRMTRVCSAASAGQTGYNQKYLINRSEQPFTTSELEVMAAAVARAEKAFDIDAQPVDFSDPVDAVENLQTRARDLFKFVKNNGGDPQGINEYALVYLGRQHRKYGLRRALLFAPLYPLLAVWTCVPFVGWFFADEDWNSLLRRSVFSRRLAGDAQWQ